MPGKSKRRKRKHRGTQAGGIDRRGRGRPRSRQEAMARARSQPSQRGLRPPTWEGAAKRGILFAVLLFPLSAFVFNQPIAGAAVLTVIASIVYVPLGYHTDRFFYRRRLAREQSERAARKAKREP